VIIDLDDAQFINPPKRFIAGTKRYRAPEIYGGFGWGTGVDIFSAGCVLYELYTGLPLLPDTPDISFLFAMMEKTIGNFDTMYADKFAMSYPSLFANTIPRRINFPKEAVEEEASMAELDGVAPLSVR